MDLQAFLDLFKLLEVQITLALILVLILSLVIGQRMSLNKLKKSLAELETQYTSIKSIPLPFKINKAVALARVNDSILEMVNDFKNSFEQITENLKSIAHVLAETEDAIIIGKRKQVKLNLADLAGMLRACEKQVNSLNESLDKILEEENQQRTNITELKDFFRQLKSEVQARSVHIALALPNIEIRLEDIEKAFSTFEEWMYASEFGKAKEKMEEISESLKSVSEMVSSLPEMISIAKGIIPKQVTEISNLFERLKNNGVYVSHLEVEKNIQFIQETTLEDENNLARLNMEEVNDHLKDNQQRLSQLHAQLLKEEQAHQELEMQLHGLEQDLDTALKLQAQLKEILTKDADRFGWEELNSLLKTKDAELKKLLKEVTKYSSANAKHSVPSSTLMLSIREAMQMLNNVKSDLDHASNRLKTARNDEERAQKQLLKLHLIMNEIQVKIRKYRLPVISVTYEEDLMKSYQYVNSINKLLGENPIDIRLLNATVNDGIDFIYRLYNNVNNLVGTVEMVENTIVYGNKFRPYDAELDASLTRAELLYKNGDYTQAIKVAIEAVESLDPEHYENLIRENAKSAQA